MVLLPPDITNADGKMLDDLQIPELAARLQTPVKVFEGDWRAVFDALNEQAAR